jgi:hypothetical protein
LFFSIAEAMTTGMTAAAQAARSEHAAHLGSRDARAGNYLISADVRLPGRMLTDRWTPVAAFGLSPG